MNRIRHPGSITIGETQRYCEAMFCTKYNRVFDFLNYFDRLSTEEQNTMLLMTSVWLFNESENKG